MSSAVGHLLELTLPEEFEVKRGKWTFAHLPVIPPHFAVKPIEKTEDRLKLLTRLVFALCAALEAVEPTVDAVLDGLVVAQFEVQEGQVLECAPVASIKRGCRCS